VEAMERLEAGSLPLTAQSGIGMTYAAKIEKPELRIDFTQPAAFVRNRVRAFSPAPGAFVEIAVGGKVERIKVLSCAVEQGSGAPGVFIDDRLAVACGSGSVRLLEVQRSGGKPMAAADFLRGFSIAGGSAVVSV
jgi:methionyl-tRNA formyltransferase